MIRCNNHISNQNSIYIINMMDILIKKLDKAFLSSYNSSKL